MKTFFWKDAWLGSEPLCTRMKQAVGNRILGLKVAEYWKCGVGWKWSLLHGMLPTFDLVKLVSTILTLDPGRDDTWEWIKIGSTWFSVKEAYKLANAWKEELARRGFGR